MGGRKVNYIEELKIINAYMLNDSRIKFSQYVMIRNAMSTIIKALGADEAEFAKKSAILARALDGENSSSND